MASPAPGTITIRRAKPGETDKIAAFITPFVEKGRLLPRTYDELDDLIATLFIAEYQGEIVGCAALEIYSKKLSEIRSLAVSPMVQGLGIGKLLVKACVELARERDVLEVMAITSSDEFFKACGFDFTLPGEKKALFYQSSTDA